MAEAIDSVTSVTSVKILIEPKIYDYRWGFNHVLPPIKYSHNMYNSYNVQYFVTPQGATAWTSSADRDGWYYSYYFKPVGKGARTGEAYYYSLVERKTGKRRTRQACKSRSYKLLTGRPFPKKKEEQKSLKRDDDNAFCLSEKKFVKVVNWKPLFTVDEHSGRRQLLGNCPDCDAKIYQWGHFIECPECGDLQPSAKNDYICKICRM